MYWKKKSSSYDEDFLCSHLGSNQGPKDYEFFHVYIRVVFIGSFA
jgi:hypothetical protein